MAETLSTRIARNWKAIAATTITLALAVFLVAAPAADAASYKTCTYIGSGSTSVYKAKVGKVTFKTSGTYSSANGGTIYKLTMTKGGKTKTLAKKVDGVFTTNGKYVYYAKRGARVTSDTSSMEWLWNHRKNTIYRLNVKTGAKKKIVSGVNIVPRGALGKYLYYGKYPSAASDTQTLYAMNMKTKKKRALAGVSYDGICNGRVICHNWTNAGGGMPLYSYKKGGTGKILIASNMCGTSGMVKIRGKKLTYVATDNTNYRTYRCTAKGKNKKALCGWTSSLQSAQAYL